jgi:AraC-like DNA-binding protein
VADVLIRGLSVAAVARIDADAAACGLSRQEHLRRRFEAEGAITPPHRPARLMVEDLDRAAAAAADLEDAAMMRKAWR